MTAAMRGSRLHPVRLLAVALAFVLSVAAVGDVPAASAGDPAPHPVASLPSFGLPSDAELGVDAARALTDTPTALGEIDLGTVVDSGTATANALKAEEWNLQDLEWSLQGDPQAAFAFVRDRIRFEPYAGVLRGPQGTLAARAGNAFDRALLLKTLLDSMLVPARFAFSTLDDATAARVLATSFMSPTAPLQDAGLASVAPLDPVAIVSRARRDYARLRQALGDRINTLATGAPDLSLSHTRQHVWVQMAAGPTWVDMDPSMPDAVAGQPLVPATTTTDSIPPESYQTVELQLIAQTNTDGQLTESTILQRRFSAADDATSEVFLYFQPDVTGLGGTILNTLTGIQNYEAELLVNGTVQSGSPFIVSATGTDIFGNPSGSSAQLAGMRLVLTTQSPTEPPRTAVKVLLDRVPVNLQGQTSIPLDQLLPLAGDAGGTYALQPIRHIVISNGGSDPRDHAIQTAVVADFGSELIDPQSASDYAMQDILWPMAVGDRVLALASERAIVAGLSAGTDVRAVIAQPRVYITSIGPDATSASGIALDTDLALDGVRIVSKGTPDVPTVARHQLWYGALQTALESEFALRVSRSLDAGGRRLDGASFATSRAASLTALDGASIPVSAPAALIAALRSGETVLVPGDATAARVWWSVGAGGITRSVLDPDLGGTRSGGRYDGVRQRPPTKGGGSGNYKYQRAAPPPSRCGGGQEYVAIVGCVSVPAAWAIRIGVGVAVAVATQYAWTTLVIN
jgi:hypothetical protein